MTIGPLETNVGSSCTLPEQVGHRGRRWLWNKGCECLKRKCLRRVSLSRSSITSKKAPKSIYISLLENNYDVPQLQA